MLGKCINPSCSASFRYLEEGLLFRLESDPTLRISNPKTPEYYWLCPACSTTMTLHIDTEGRIVTAPNPVAVHDTRVDLVPMSVRQSGLLLRSVRSSLRESNGHRMTARLKEAHHAL